jgi:hypothetical protein
VTFAIKIFFPLYLRKHLLTLNWIYPASSYLSRKAILHWKLTRKESTGRQTVVLLSSHDNHLTYCRRADRLLERTKFRTSTHLHVICCPRSPWKHTNRRYHECGPIGASDGLWQQNADIDCQQTGDNKARHFVTQRLTFYTPCSMPSNKILSLRRHCCLSLQWTVCTVGRRNIC